MRTSEIAGKMTMVRTTFGDYSASAAEEALKTYNPKHAINAMSSSWKSLNSELYSTSQEKTDLRLRDMKTDGSSTSKKHSLTTSRKDFDSQRASSSRETRICFNCNASGHVKKDCPRPLAKGKD